VDGDTDGDPDVDGAAVGYSVEPRPGNVGVGAGGLHGHGGGTGGTVRDGVVVRRAAGGASGAGDPVAFARRGSACGAGIGARVVP
jgi:hypothetical protein